MFQTAGSRNRKFNTANIKHLHWTLPHTHQKVWGWFNSASTLCNGMGIYVQGELTFSSNVPWESSVCRFCSNSANPEAYNDISSSCRTETPTQKRAQCIGDSYTRHKRMYICKSKFKKYIPYSNQVSPQPTVMIVLCNWSSTKHLLNKWWNVV